MHLKTLTYCPTMAMAASSLPLAAARWSAVDQGATSLHGGRAGYDVRKSIIHVLQ